MFGRRGLAPSAVKSLRFAPINALGFSSPALDRFHPACPTDQLRKAGSLRKFDKDEGDAGGEVRAMAEPKYTIRLSTD